MLPAEKNFPQEEPEQLRLFTEPLMYHREGDRGFFATLQRKAGAPKNNGWQKVYRLDRLAFVLEHLNPQHDSWISQGEFFKPNRKVVNLARIGLCFADLDTYKTPLLKGLTPAATAQAVRVFMADRGIPQPTLILFSGQGLQLKWVFDRALPAAALPRWNAVQKALCLLLKDCGGDMGARDASRVLRVEHTVNTKSGEIVRILEYSGIEYDFDQLADNLLQFTREEFEQRRKAAAEENAKREKQAKVKLLEGGGKENLLRLINYRQLAWDRMNDLRRLGDIRGGEWADYNQRTVALFWQINFLVLAGAVTSTNLYNEAAELAKQIGGPQWEYNKGELGTVYYKACQWARGETVDFHGKAYPALYTPKNQTLIDIFGIDENEERQLKTIVSEAEARRRDAERAKAKRKAAGAVSREEYKANAQAAAQARAAEARRLRSEGLSIRQIAERLKVSVGSIHSDLKGV